MRHVEASRSTIVESLCRAADLCEDHVQRVGDAIELILDLGLDQGIEAQAVRRDIGRLELGTVFRRHDATRDRWVERTHRASTHVSTITAAARQACDAAIDLAAREDRADLCAIVAFLLDDLEELEELAEDAERDVVALGESLESPMVDVESSAAATAAQLAELAEQAEARVQGLLSLARRCLSLLQFQDPLCQELRAIGAGVRHATPDDAAMGAWMGRTQRASTRIHQPVSEASLALSEVSAFYRDATALRARLTTALLTPDANGLSPAVTRVRRLVAARCTSLVDNSEARRVVVRRAVARCRALLDGNLAGADPGNRAHGSARALDVEIATILEQLAGLHEEAERSRDAAIGFGNDVADVLAHTEARVRGAEHALRTALGRDAGTRDTIEKAAHHAVEQLAVESAYTTCLDRALEAFRALGHEPADFDPSDALDADPPEELGLGAGELLLF